jgi:phenylacetate-CoA ligase
MLSALLWPLYIRAKGLEPELQGIDSFARSNPVERRIQMARKLLAQIRYFGMREDALPEWREAARMRSPLDLWARWSDLPILTKDVLRRRFPAQEIARRFELRGLVSATGGSTGEPTSYFHDEAMLRSSSVRMLYSRMAMGWRPGMATVVVWGSERDVGHQRTLRSRISAFLRDEHLVDGYNLGPRTVSSVVRLIEKHRPVALFGFTSMLEFVAREVLKSGGIPPPGAVAAAWNGGEMLFPEQSALFEQAFGTPLLNCYGCRELSTLAFQPVRGTPLLVLRPHVLLEIVDSRGRAAAPGESGRLIWTSTKCRGTPFLRYELGDRGSYRAADCDESGIGAIAELEGRSAGLLELPNGRVINCLYWNHLLKEFPEVHQFQVAIGDGGRIELRLAGEGFEARREQMLRDVLGRFLGGLPVAVRWMERIPLSPQGKLVQVVDER